MREGVITFVMVHMQHIFVNREQNCYLVDAVNQKYGILCSGVRGYGVVSCETWIILSNITAFNVCVM